MKWTVLITAAVLFVLLQGCGSSTAADTSGTAAAYTPPAPEETGTMPKPPSPPAL